MPDPLLTIVATDVRPGALLLDHLNSRVEVTRYYHFLDAQGHKISLLGDRESGHVIPIADIPGSIRAALQLINAWTIGLLLQGLQNDST